MRRVALYGKSLAVSIIGASLEGRADVQVVCVDAALPGAAGRLRGINPDVVIFDLATTALDSATTLWSAQRHLLLIGVDLTGDRALVLSSQCPKVFTLDDLMQIIDTHAVTERSER